MRDAGRGRDGGPITTLEGLLQDGKPSPVQQAFIAEDAAPWGYGTNGLMMAATIFLRQHPHPREEQIKADQSGVGAVVVPLWDALSDRPAGAAGGAGDGVRTAR